MLAKPGGVDAVARALTILSAFGEGASDMPLAELARRTGLYKSTILRICTSLEAHRFLIRGTDGMFRLGPELWRLGALYRRSFDLGEYVRPVLRRMVAETQETASFFIRDGDERVCLHRLNSPRAVRHHLDEGVRLPLDRGAAGRVLLAFGDPGDPRGGDIRRTGYAVTRGERDPELAAIAAPVFDPSGQLRGALSLSTLCSRLDAAKEASTRAILLAAATELSAALPAGVDMPPVTA